MTSDAPFAHLSPELNRVPENVRHVHLMGICGTGMASLAGLLRHQGFRVTGSDQQTYPPMSTFLESLGIPVLEGYRPQNLSPLPDLVIVGNVITRLNPEAVELARLALPYVSFPQALRQFAMKGKKSIVVSGTHGKTTTSSLAAWVLETARLQPGFLIGGLPGNFGSGFQAGEGPYFVIEGDEYDTAFFDKGPKFLHYNPWIAIITSIEFDHADIYRDLDHVTESFKKLIDLIPEDGLLIANGDDPVVRREMKRARCPVTTYSLEGNGDWGVRDLSRQGPCTRLRVIQRGEERATLETPLFGRHNISNILSVVALAEHLQVPEGSLAQALQTFQGVRRRQEAVGEPQGVLILDDFAHHPTAVRETLRAVRERYKGRRLIAAFEPRSNSSRRNVFQRHYAAAFEGADMVMIPEPPMMEKVPQDIRFSSRRLVDDLKARGADARYWGSTGELLEALKRVVRPGDVVLFMSNGAFDRLPYRLAQSLGKEILGERTS
jgi:UDP-N-acetylmuramate: L-alanyl-gamma-D-glutamyl-meso-diaminopimelate ligase